MEYSTLIAEDGINKAHLFDSTEDAVHACHWEDNVKIGDTLVVESEGVVGLATHCPFAITDEAGAFDSIPRQWKTPSAYAYENFMTVHQVAHAYYIKAVMEQIQREYK